MCLTLAPLGWSLLLLMCVTVFAATLLMYYIPKHSTNAVGPGNADLVDGELHCTLCCWSRRWDTCVCRSLADGTQYRLYIHCWKKNWEYLSELKYWIINLSLSKGPWFIHRFQHLMSNWQSFPVSCLVQLVSKYSSHVTISIKKYYNYFALYTIQCWSNHSRDILYIHNITFLLLVENTQTLHACKIMLKGITTVVTVTKSKQIQDIL